MARPVASVIIPLYNNVALTQACLEALVASTPDYLYEVVLVDNGSSDGTGALLDALDGDVRIIRNRVNRGFAAACNQGAQAASGEYLVFLNNDTEPEVGWLEPLVGTADGHAKVGAVGSKLLFPDGKLQHAGVIIVDDQVNGFLEGRHRWYGEAGDFEPANVTGVVKAVTAAAMLVRPQAFAEAGGFDEGYWNGNEDIDLCLKIGAAGWQVVYQPASRVVHHESVSGPERWSKCVENMERFRARWYGRVQPDVVLTP